ncbi:MAG: hypothetical protein AVDCRST_MAG76-1805 [uncultured Acidimicrobiales bacterium]|uniref:Uncharacterized protein n=1 Tax=uncultured Acidimicrobiales bacterium TaxID=310071 RepID=A0A6J4I5I8_9ACTN|nr:MAG: hypothetical protein AVDCRST_MAG76-1805 [uncultured Acidimicrobiales bacterium]
MARGGRLRKGLRIGLLAGVGLAAVRAARARRAQLPTVTPPTWPPLPTALGAEPPAAVTSGGPAAAGAVEAAAAEHGTAALVAEAAVLEAAGITEAAEVDEDAVLTRRRQMAAAPAEADEVRSAWGPPPPAGAAPPLGEAPWAADLLDDLDPGAAPPGSPGPTDDLDGIILGEEAALEAERLEAEQLELARLERARLTGEEDANGRAQREVEREEALARFAAQRQEAEALLALQEERAANGGSGSRAGQLEPDEAVEPWAQPLEGDQLPEPTLEPLVPDEAVADLEEEPAWGRAVEPASEPHPPEPWEETDLESERARLEPELTAPPFADMDRGAGDDPAGLEQDTRRPLMAADLESGFGDGASAQPEPDEDVDDYDEPLSAWPAAPTEAWPADDIEDEAGTHPGPDDDAELEPALDALGSDGLDLVEQWPPRAKGLEDPHSQPDDRPDVELDQEDDRDPQPSGRRPIMTSDFDDEERVGAPATVQRQRRSGAPRVPLKARRPDSEVGDQPGADDQAPIEVDPSPPPPDPATRPVRKTTKKVVKAGPAKAQPAPARPVKRASSPSAGAARKVAKPVSGAKKASTTTTRKAAAAPQPAAKKVSSRKKKPDVLWVEPVGGACPTSHPVKASLSSGIFHVVGGLFYERSRADRCYVDAAAATADGLRQAKR